MCQRGEKLKSQVIEIVRVFCWGQVGDEQCSNFDHDRSSIDALITSATDSWLTFFKGREKTIHECEAVHSNVCCDTRTKVQHCIY